MTPINEKDVRRVWNAQMPGNDFFHAIDQAVYDHAPMIARKVNYKLGATGRVDVEQVIAETLLESIKSGLE